MPRTSINLWNMSEDSVIFLAEVNLSQVHIKSAVQATFSPSPLNVPEENVAGERREESPVGGLVYNRSGEPVVHCDEPELPRTDVCGSDFEVGAPTLEEEAERKKIQMKRAPKSPLTAVLENW